MPRGDRWRTGQGRPGRASAADGRLDWPRTLAAKRGRPLEAAHLRYRPARPGLEALHCFVLDCSGSMLRESRLARAKGVLLALFEQAARRRHRVALVCFGGAGAQLRFGPAVPRWWSERWLAPIGGGGGTPLRAGLAEAAGVLQRDRRRRPGAERWLWLLSDGRSRERPAAPPAERVLVVDFETGPLPLGGCRMLAQNLDAEYLAAEAIVGWER